MFVTISFWALVYGGAISNVSEVDADLVGRAGSAYGLALILVPAVFASAAFLSRRTDAPIMVLAGMGVFLGVGLLALVLGNPAAALITGYAAGGVVSLSRDDGLPLRNRWIAAAAVGVVVHAGFVVLAAPTAWLAPALPFTAMGLADALTTPRSPEGSEVTA